MRVSIVAVAILVALGPPVAAGAELVVWEPFDYAAGTELDDFPASALGLSGNYLKEAVLRAQVDDAPLDYGNLGGLVPTAAGLSLTHLNSVSHSFSTVALADGGIADIAGQPVFVSALMMMSDATGGRNRASVILRHESTGDLIDFGSQIVGTRALVVGATTGAGGNLSDSVNLGYNDGDLLLFVLRYINRPTSDDIDLLIYDANSGAEIPENFDPQDPGALHSLSISGTIDLTRIDRLELLIRGSDDNRIDEVRIARSYRALLQDAPQLPMFSHPHIALPVLLAGAILVVYRHRVQRQEEAGQR